MPLVAELIGNVVKTNQSSINAKEFILKYPSSVYTSTRTVGRKILMLNDHVDRLNVGLSEQDRHQMKQRMVQILKEARSIESNESKIVVLRNAANQLFAHFSPLLPHPDPCIVQIAAMKRTNPTVKHTDWVKDRQALDAIQEKDVNEVLLLDQPTGEITEGTQTNLVVVVERNGKQFLQTAPLDKVLYGTILKMAEKAAMDMGVELVYECPKVKEMDEWKGAFISSTSRLVLPICKIRITDECKIIPQSPLVEQLKRRVEQMVDACSEEIE